MFQKTKIYIDKTSLEIIAQDSTIADNYYKNIIEIFRRNADMYIDATEEELEQMKEPEDLNDPGDIFTFIERRNLPWPAAASEKFEGFQQSEDSQHDEPHIEKNGNVIYILDVKKEIAERIREHYGVWVLSVDEINDDIFSYSFNKHFNRSEVPGKSQNGWENLLASEVTYLPPSNSFVLSDSNLLTNEILDKDKKKHYRGLENVKNLLDVILPAKSDIPFYILVICPAKTEQIGKMKKIIARWIDEVKNLREKRYTIIVEFFITSKTLHSRQLYANNYRIYLDKGFYVFEPWSTKVHLDGESFNKIDIKSYLNSPFDRGDSILDVALAELDEIKKKYDKFLKGTGDPSIVVPLDETEYSKNRILF